VSLSVSISVSLPVSLSVSPVNGEIPWNPAARLDPLAADEIHLWRLAHERDASARGRYDTILSPEEKRRAARFRVARSREEFVQTRGCLRLLLAHYTGLPHAALSLESGPFGKPSLPRHHLSFNVSHTEGVSLIAIAHSRVGVDVERVVASPDLPAIAHSHFSPGEIAKLQALSGREHTEAFFRCWTRKEAFLKAQGFGLPHGLDSFEVSLLPGEPPEVLACAWQPDARDRWLLVHVAPAADTFGALATQRPDRHSAPRIVPFDWSPNLARQLLS
jgi:4'-phosphopantetheinyl transferase